MLSYPVRLRPVILLLGDSLTQQGFGMNGGAGWASLLANAYSRSADVLNRGYSGYNSRHVSRIVDSLFSTNEQLLGTELLFCAVFLGANDAALPGERQHVPIDEYEANLGTIVTSIRSTIRNDLPIVLLTPPPVDTNKWDRHNKNLERDPSYRANNVAKRYGDRVKAVARQYDCFVVDVFALLGGQEETHAPHLSDGLHLSGSGNELVYDGLMKLLEDTDMAPSTMEWDRYTNSVAVRTRPSIVLLGDSLTKFGFEDLGWASLLASDYSRRADVLNRGFQGYNRRELKASISETLHSDAVDGALFVTLWLGSIDAFSTGDERHVPLDEFQANLETIITNVRERILPPTTPQGECMDHLPMVLMTPLPIEQSKSEDLGLTNEINRQYADRVYLVAPKYNCLVLDLFEILDRDEEFCTDGLGLSKNGNALVYEGIKGLIKKHYPQLAPMTDGNGKYGDTGIPLEEKLWFELC